MKNLLILLTVLITSFSYGQKYGDPTDGFRKEVKYLGKNIEATQKFAMKLAKKYNGEFKTHEGFKGIKVVEVAWTNKKGNYHKHKWYFRGGPFCDGYEYITTYDNHYSLIKQAFKSAADEHYGNGDIKVSPKRFVYSVFDIRTRETYYSPKNKIYVGFGGKQINDGKNQYKIEIYRAGIYFNTK